MPHVQDDDANTPAQDRTQLGVAELVKGAVVVDRCVNSAESLVAAARLGLGLIQVPRYHVEPDLKQGTLVAVLPDCPPSPTPVSLLYPRNRQLSPRVRVFIDWLVPAFGAARSAGDDRDLTGSSKPS